MRDGEISEATGAGGSEGAWGLVLLLWEKAGQSFLRVGRGQAMGQAAAPSALGLSLLGQAVRAPPGMRSL